MGELHVVLIDHRVCHSCLDLAVSEKLLHLFDRHAFVYRPCCKRAAELVRVDFCDAEAPPKFSQANFHAADLQALMWFLERDKERRIIVCTAVQIAREVNLRACIEIDRALLASLAEHNALAPLKINVAAVQPYELPDTHSGGGEQVNHGEVANVGGVVTHLLQSLIAVCFLDDLRRLDLVNAAHGTLEDVVLVLEPCKETGKNTPDVVDVRSTARTGFLIISQIGSEVVGRQMREMTLGEGEQLSDGRLIVADGFLAASLDLLGSDEHIDKLVVFMRRAYLRRCVRRHLTYSKTAHECCLQMHHLCVVQMGQHFLQNLGDKKVFHVVVPFDRPLTPQKIRKNIPA